MARRAPPAFYGGARDVDKYSALDNRDIGAFFAAKTAPGETVFIFGFSPGAYAYADRRSASRFFWSRPVILGFNGGGPPLRRGGLGAGLESERPGRVVLHRPPTAPRPQGQPPLFT